MRIEPIDNQVTSSTKQRSPVLSRIYTIFGLIKGKILGLWTYITAYGKSVKDGYKSNAFSPLVWYVFFPLIPLFAVVLFTKNETVLYICLIAAILLIIFPLVMYIVLLCKDPKLLQSEWYRLEDKRMDMVAQKGEDPISPDSITGVQISGELDE